MIRTHQILAALASLALVMSAGAGHAQVRAETAGAVSFTHGFGGGDGALLDARFRLLFGAPAARGVASPLAAEPFRGVFESPVEGVRISSGFGMRLHPILGYVRMHDGIDYAAPLGSPVHAAGDGVVEQAQWRGGYGRWVKLAHPGGWETGYGHLSTWIVKPGDHVRQGQVIAYTGSTGLSTGPHLHYEVIRRGVKVDPDAAEILPHREEKSPEPPPKPAVSPAAQARAEPAPQAYRWAWGLVAPPASDPARSAR